LTLSEEVEEMESQQKAQRRKVANNNADGFVEFDRTKEKLIWRSPKTSEGHLIFDCPLNSKLTALSIFLKIITPSLLEKILRNLVVEADIIKKSPTKRTANDLVKLYMTLAISIRIQGRQHRPLRNRHNSRPLREAVDEAHEHFCSRNIGVSIGGQRVYYSLISVPLFTNEYAEDISSNFQKLVLRLGQYCAGDEKLFHFTGNSGDIRLVITKPDKVGLWFYELCAPLSYGGSFMLWTTKMI
jgi:hypothetical protein